MFTQKDREQFTHNIEYLRELKASCKDDNSWMREKCDELFDRESAAIVENAVLKTKVELYEKFIAKMLESDSDKSNDVFMLDGEIYRLTSYHLCSDVGAVKTLTAEFVCTTNITKNFKEGNR